MTYTFKVESRNIKGYSLVSSEFSLLSAYIAGVPDSVTTSIDGDSLKVSWSLSTDNSAAVTQYKVYIKEMVTESDFVLETTDCDGTDP